MGNQWRESIRDLTTRYNSNGDAGRFANVRELFLDDAVMDLEGDVKTGLDEIMTIFTGTQSKLHDAPASEAHQAPKDKAALPYVRQFTATHQIDVVDENNSYGQTALFRGDANRARPLGPLHRHVPNQCCRQMEVRLPPRKSRRTLRKLALRRHVDRPYEGDPSAAIRARITADNVATAFSRVAGKPATCW